jgi:hypothetical protein
VERVSISGLAATVNSNGQPAPHLLQSTKTCEV